MGLKILMLGATLTLAACAPSDDAVAEIEDVTLYLSFAIDGAQAPYIVAEQLGYFEEEGLDVTIEPGQGSADAVRVVGAGRAEFGTADAGALSNGVSQGAEAKAVGVLFRRSPAVVAVRADSDIHTVDDLVGRSFGDAEGSSTGMVFPALLERNGLSVDDVERVALTFPTRVPSLLEEQVDSIGGLEQEFVNVADQLRYIRYAENGIGSYSNVLMVNTGFLEENPEAVQAFVSASIRGLEYALDNPDEAAELVANVGDAEVSYYRAELDVISEFFVDDDVPGQHDWLWMNEERWEETQQLMVDYAGQEQAVPLTDLYTNEFVE